jgi:predicted DsbA family dithiol-disulfide isomerase
VHELVQTDPEVEINWRAFELRPEPVPSLDPQGEYLQNAWRNSVYPLAERLGITMKLPPVQPRSRLSHEAAHWARTQGRFDDYHAEVFRSFFERGEDISQIDTLTALAGKLGLNGKSLRGVLETHEFEESVLDDEREAQRLGISGVPAFVVDRKLALSGVQPVENLHQLVDRAQQK